ncbi:hypothetical protein [uncultured Thermomonospora sp.]|nr:hypothetical protein [uncultured Thermomonospora sp.]
MPPAEWVEELCAAWQRRCAELAIADRAEEPAEDTVGGEVA